MNHWPFILAAYALTIVGTVGVVWQSYVAMRRSESRAKALREEK